MLSQMEGETATFYVEVFSIKTAVVFVKVLSTFQVANAENREKVCITRTL